MPARKKSPVRRAIERAYSKDALARICTLPENSFGAEFGMQTAEVDQYPWQPWGKGAWKKDATGTYQPPAPAARDYYHFRDNGSSVLAVAHLDTVVTPGFRAPRFSSTRGGPLVRSGALDDRLGAYVILDLLPRLGVTHDWLLTVGEESGQSTAGFFTPPKDYDWIIEFDRAGTDVVMYQYEDAASRAAVQACGAPVGKGSFSDICYLDALGVKAFNWGVGYRGDYHSPHGYAYLSDTFAMAAKYLAFHEQNAGTAMSHVPSLAPHHRHANDDGYDCELCYAPGAVDISTLICAQCRCCGSCGQDELECPCFSQLKASWYTSDEEGADDGATALTWEEYAARRPA